MEPIKIIIADHHALFRSGIANALRNQSDLLVVAEAKSGNDVLAKMSEAEADLILMDTDLPEMGGLEATRRIREQAPSVKIVMLSAAADDSDHVFEAIKAGVHGYLPKQIEPKALVQAVRAISRGEVHLAGHMASHVLSELAQLATLRGRESDRENPLTLREKDVLVHLSRGATNRNIATALCISEHTVKNHIKRILAKLDLENRSQAVAFALERGITR